MTIREAFFKVCTEAQAVTGCYVTLYCEVPFYGGPEEGGWWGRDTHMVAYQAFPTMEQAERAKAAVEKMAEELNSEEKRRFGEQCQAEMDWCDARGLDYDYLGEVDGESKYFVIIEEECGSAESRGCRHYE